jgi:nucleotide-binding universal stress UspA family protein
MRTEVVPMTVIVGFDGSRSSTAALRWASGYAQSFGDTLEVIRAWQYPATMVLPLPAREPVRSPEEIEQTLQDEADAAVAETVPGDQAVKVEIVGGPAASHLIDRAADPSVRALVLGSRGLGGFSGLLLGSVTRSCLDHSAAPVVVVPGGFDGGDGVRHILVGADGSEGSTGALRWACEAGQAFGSEVIAIMVFVPDRSGLGPDGAAQLRSRTEADLERWCGGHGRKQLHPRILEGDPRTELLDAIEREEADLIAVGSRGLGEVSRLLLGSVASALTQHSPVPVAVIPSGRG